VRIAIYGVTICLADVRGKFMQHHAMKKYREIESKLLPFLSSTLVGDERSVSHFGHTKSEEFSTSSIAEIKKAWSPTSTPLHVFMPW
jgi:hypothetical protein